MSIHYHIANVKIFSVFYLFQAKKFQIFFHTLHTTQPNKIRKALHFNILNTNKRIKYALLQKTGHAKYYCANNKIHSRNIPPPLRPKIPAGGLTPCRRPGFALTDNRACSETTTPTAVTRKTAALRQPIRQRQNVRIPRAKPGQQPPFPYIIIGKHRAGDCFRRQGKRICTYNKDHKAAANSTFSGKKELKFAFARKFCLFYAKIV